MKNIINSLNKNNLNNLTFKHIIYLILNCYEIYDNYKYEIYNNDIDIDIDINFHNYINTNLYLNCLNYLNQFNTEIYHYFLKHKTSYNLTFQFDFNNLYQFAKKFNIKSNKQFFLIGNLNYFRQKYKLII